MERYDSYKDSGVKWLGEIPSHWTTPRINQIGRYINGYAFKPKDWSNSGKPIIRIQDLTGSNDNPNYYNGNLDKKYLVKKGDVLVSWAATLDAYIWEKEDGWLNQHIFKAIPLRDINKNYFLWLLKVAMQNLNNDNKHGIMMQHLTAVVFNHFRIPLPSADEQEAITNYLDKATAKIDEAIAQQQKMIDLLNERKQIIINNAVTKGLDPNVKMKSSGVDWIGEINSRWTIFKLKHLIKSNLMYGANESAESEDRSLPRYIRITDIDEEGRLKEETFKSLSLSKSAPYLLNRGDVLFARSGATAGKTYLFNEDYPACFAGYLIKATTNNMLLPKYLIYFTRSGVYENWKNSIFIQATIPNIGADKYSCLLIPLPKIKEQEEVIEYLDGKTNKINNVIDSCIRQISLLQERKQIIINDVVTGKIKVV